MSASTLSRDAGAPRRAGRVRVGDRVRRALGTVAMPRWLAPIVRPRRTFAIHKLVLATIVFLFVKGDGGGGGCCSDAEGVLGLPTEATCPPSSPLTYANFGQPFMAQYCTRCHSSALAGAARMGAPAFHDFDTQIGVQRVADHVDAAAGSGPAATNQRMPPSDPRPTMEERQQLAEWIACGAP